MRKSELRAALAAELAAQSRPLPADFGGLTVIQLRERLNAVKEHEQSQHQAPEEELAPEQGPQAPTVFSAEQVAAQYAKLQARWASSDRRDRNLAAYLSRITKAIARKANALLRATGPQIELYHPTQKRWIPLENTDLVFHSGDFTASE